MLITQSQIKLLSILSCLLVGTGCDPSEEVMLDGETGEFDSSIPDTPPDEEAAPGEFDIESGDDPGTTPVVLTTWNVPFIRQRDFTGIGESACAPTSLAMILRYYYPNSKIDVREIYHAGMQSYNYNGPARGYWNLSWGDGWGTDPGYSAIPNAYYGYYSSLGYAGVRGNSSIQQYLNVIWGVNSSVLATEASLYTALANGPVIGHVWGHGNTNWGHYLVIRGIDNKGTVNHSDDTIYVNDPYDNWWQGDSSGSNRAISYHDFFVAAKYGSPWFRDAISLTPQDTQTQRAYTVVVDTGHNPTSGSTTNHVFQVDNVNDLVDGTNTYTWWMKYDTYGDYYFPKEANHIARWTPKLTVSGAYQVSVKYLATPSSGNVTYRIYNAQGVEQVAVVVNQQSNATQWKYAVISNSISLSNGAYVRATNIAANSSIDAVKFKYLNP